MGIGAGWTVEAALFGEAAAAGAGGFKGKATGAEAITGQPFVSNSTPSFRVAAFSGLALLGSEAGAGDACCRTRINEATITPMASTKPAPRVEPKAVRDTVPGHNPCFPGRGLRGMLKGCSVRA